MLVTWTIERFVQTSESMRSRGSSLKGRTAFSIYRFDNRDRSLVIVFFILLTLCLCAMILDQTHILYAPELVVNRFTAMSLVFLLAYAAACFLPLALQVVGELRFASLTRAIDPNGKDSMQ